MDNKITIREASTDTDVGIFGEELRIYQKRDIFPDPEDEDREYFLSDDEYRVHIQKLHDRLQDRIRYLFFCRGGADIGFAMPVVYETEDGKCFILEFCVYPEFRGNGTGRQCARVLLDWAGRNGAKYAELNCNTEQRQRFWSSVGFVRNGADEWGDPLMLLPPEEELPFTVETLTDGSDWQLHHLLNSFLTEIGEEVLDDERKERLAKAVGDGKIQFFLAKRGYRAVGICSVSPHFSTFACKTSGVFDDFYVEPVFRKKGIARLLTDAARKWCREQGYASLTVGCADCDEAMYRSLGFQTRLGTMLASDL